MLDIGWQELFIVAVVAIVVIGPRELPRALKAIAQVLRKARAMTREFQDGFDELVRDTELDELKKELSGASPSGIARKFEQTVDPTGEIGDAVREADPTQDVRQALDTGEPEPASEPKIALEPEPAPEPEPEPKPKAKPKPKPRPAAKRKAGGAA